MASASGENCDDGPGSSEWGDHHGMTMEDVIACNSELRAKLAESEYQATMERLARIQAEQERDQAIRACFIYDTKVGGWTIPNPDYFTRFQAERLYVVREAIARKQGSRL